MSILLILITYSIIADILISRTLHESNSLEDFSTMFLNSTASLFRNIDRVNIPIILIMVTFSDTLNLFKSNYLDLIMFSCFYGFLLLEIVAQVKRITKSRDDQYIVNSFSEVISRHPDVPIQTYFRTSEQLNFIGITLKFYIILIILKNL